MSKYTAHIRKQGSTTLCGEEDHSSIYSISSYINYPDPISATWCPKCLEHPSIPLLMLKAVEL